MSVTPKQILNYYDWLFSDDNWVGRSKAVLKNRTKAKKKLELADQTYNNAFAKLKEKDDYRDLLAKWSRKEARDYDTAHHIDSKGQPKTAALGALTGKWLKIKAFMAPGDSNAPDEGVKPEEKSGTADL